jgi:TPR repeat protein
MHAKNYEAMSDKKLLKEAKKGDPEAQNFAGVRCYCNGEFEMAAEFWRLSAKQKNISGLYNRGRALASGKGVEQNPVMAVRRFYEAFKKGDNESLVDISQVWSETKGEDFLKIAEILGMEPKFPKFPMHAGVSPAAPAA